MVYHYVAMIMLKRGSRNSFFSMWHFSWYSKTLYKITFEKETNKFKMLSDIKSNSTKVEQVDEVEGGPVM